MATGSRRRILARFMRSRLCWPFKRKISKEIQRGASCLLEACDGGGKGGSLSTYNTIPTRTDLGNLWYRTILYGTS